MQFIYRKIFSFRLPGYSLSWEHFTHMNLLCSCFCPAHYIVKSPWFQEDFTFFFQFFTIKYQPCILRCCYRSDSKTFDSSKSEEGEQCGYHKAGHIEADFNSGIRHFRDIRYFTREQIHRDNRELAAVWLVSDQVMDGQHSVTGSTVLPFDTRSFFFYFRICPVPYTIFLIDVSASSPIGPLAWSFWVLIPI